MKRALLFIGVSFGFSFFVNVNVFANANANANIYSHKLDVTNGLPDYEIRCMAQDDLGFMWFGGISGLYRFDGYFYKEFHSAETGNNSLLKANHVRTLKYWKDGLLLIIMAGDYVTFYDVHNNKFVGLADKYASWKFAKYKILGNRKLMLGAKAKSITIDYVNGKLIYKETGEYKDIEKETAVSVCKQLGISNAEGLFFDNLGNYIIADEGIGLSYVDRSTHEIIRLDVFNPSLVHMDLSRKYKVLTMKEQGYIWVSTYGGGLTIYDMKTKEVTHLNRFSYPQSDLLKTDYIVDIEADNRGNVWASEEYYGVTCFSMQDNSPSRLLLNDKRSEAHQNQIKVLRRLSDGNIYASSNDIIYKFDGALNKKEVFATGIDMRDIFIDNKGRMWISTRKHGLLVDGKSITNFPTNRVNMLLQDKDGHMWITTQKSGLCLAKEGKNGTFTFKQYFKGKTFRTIMQDHKGFIWVGGEEGVYRFDPKQLINHGDSTAFRTFAKANSNPSTLNSQLFTETVCLFEDANQCVWIGTIGNGAYFCNDIEGELKFTPYNVSNGLIDNNVQSIVSSTNPDEVILATKHGLTIYSIKNNISKYIYLNNDAQENYFTENNVCVVDGKGVMAFGTQAGIVSIDMHAIANDSKNNRLTITDVINDGNNYTIHFSTFNYLAPEGTKYSYWLEGYEKEWSALSKNSYASYKNLAPGTYTIHVKAFENNEWNGEERLLTLEVPHPWWATWWAILIYIGVGTCIGVGVLRQLYTIYKLRQDISMEKTLTQYKLQFFTNISHEFRTPLTIIKGSVDMISSKGSIPSELRQPLANIMSGTTRMLRLINQLLEFRKMQNGKLQLSLQQVDIVTFVRHLGETMEDIAHGKQINYYFMANVKSYEMFVDKDYIDKIVYNLLSNAFKYTPAGGTVKMSLNISDKLILSVADTGIGIPEEKRDRLFSRYLQSQYVSDSFGIGLNLTAELVKVHHGKISYAPNPDGGSIFTVMLPVDANVYKEADFMKQSSLHEQLTINNEQLSNYKEVSAQPMNDKRILLVEDDGELAEYMRSLLAHYFIVQTATDGETACRMIGEEMPDLVVSDVMMPGMDGFQLTEKLRNNDKTSNLPIVLLTALTDDEKRIKGLSKGADAYITKPFNVELLLVTIGKLMEVKSGACSQVSLKTNAKIIIEEKEKRFFDEMNIWLDSRLSRTDISVDAWAEAMGTGRSSFFKKVKSLTGMTPNEYIRKHRLQKAMTMLKEERKTVSEVAYATGFNTPFYFSKCFKDEFGISPSSLLH